jgi:hypothetical protein
VNHDHHEADDDAQAEAEARWRARFIALALGLLCVALLVGKTAWDGSAALAEGDAAARRGEVDAAIRRWTEAARAYLPGAAYVGMAHRRLLDAGDAAAASDEPGGAERAERAYAAVGEAIADTQWAITPFPEELARAEAGRRALRQPAGAVRIARAPRRSAKAAAASSSEVAPAISATAAPIDLAPRLAAAMRARGWAAVAFGGLLGVGLAIALLRRAGNGRGREVVRRTWLAVAVLAGSALLFALGVHQV